MVTFLRNGCKRQIYADAKRPVVAEGQEKKHGLTQRGTGNFGGR